MILVIVLLLIAIAYCDLEAMTVSNGLIAAFSLLTLTMAVTQQGLVASTAFHFSPWPMVVVLLITLPGFAAGLFGGADVKVLAALSLITSLSQILAILLLAFALFAFYWLVAIRERQQKGPFIPSLLVATAVVAWLG
ncbi:prepilin peptidase [Photobacterium rosenbergii]|uniref:Prepilin peptidase n=1 Tax=Photobacterium rosenbergii TaxID=294936 RepID=A0ABU3ZF45_9GAMM|nr:prepilin peptidase [Photobacterium rosenbergii]MDV5168677.1 prepilin peptidase [Photobacterium rosenbergii]